MKITLSIFFCLSLVLMNAQSNFKVTYAKFKTEISFLFSTPDALPYVGEIADEVVEYLESEEEKKKYKDWELAYPEITEELNALVGVDTYALHGGAQYFPYGHFKIGETTFLMVLETGFEARSMQPFQSLVLLAFDKDYAYKSIHQLMFEESSVEYELEDYEDVNEAYYIRSRSSKLDVIYDILTITSTELNVTQLIRENETEEEKSTHSNIYKYLPSKGEFEMQFD